MLRVERNFSKNTINAYKRDLEQYFKYLYMEQELKSPSDISLKHIQGYIRKLSNKGLSPKSIARIMSSIRSYHNYLSYEEIIKENPTLLVDTPKIAKKLPEILTVETISHIVESINELSIFSKRDKAIIEMLYSCGLRVTELCDLDISNIDLDGEIIVVMGKGSKERLLPLMGNLKIYLKDYLYNSRPLFRKKTNSSSVFLSKNGEKLTRMMVFNILDTHFVESHLKIKKNLSSLVSISKYKSKPKFEILKNRKKTITNFNPVKKNKYFYGLNGSIFLSTLYFINKYNRLYRKGSYCYETKYKSSIDIDTIDDIKLIKKYI